VGIAVFVHLQASPERLDRLLGATDRRQSPALRAPRLAGVRIRQDGLLRDNHCLPRPAHAYE